MTNSGEFAHGDGPQGKYRILARLGEGGAATVYLAVARGPSGFSKLLVLKILKKGTADEPEQHRMFLSEARLAARLNHPNIVQTNEVVEDHGAPVIVMEYLEGQALSKMLIRAKRKIPLTTHLRIITDALTGLHYAHELKDFDGKHLGLVHRDMTPQNVFVTFDGQVKVLDFGIAKLVATDKHETKTGVIKGKLRYMPREQIRGEGIDRRTDIYAAGVMLWEAAAGQHLWKGMTDVQVLKQVLNGEAPSPRTVRPEVPERLEQICMKALAPDPNERHATAAELEAELEGALDEFGSRVTSRAIGKVVSDLFEAERKKIRSLIEAQMSNVASLSAEEYGAIEASTKSGLLVSSVTTLGETGSLPRRDGEQKRRAIALIAVVGGAALAGLGALRMTGRNSEPAQPTAVPAPAASLTSNDPPEPSPARVSIRISASPPEAKLFFDGEQLATNPFIRLLAPDTSQHEVRAEVDGYQVGSASIAGDRDGEVLLKLDRIQADRRKVSGPSVSVHRKSGASAPKAACEPPFTVDSQGIKKFKVECL